MMLNRSAYLLVVHGSRNLSYGEQLHQLLTMIRSQLDLQDRAILIGTAYLELAPQPLHQTIVDFAHQSAQQGCEFVKILPLFLASGTHVVNDIPEQVAIAQTNSPLSLELLPHLGKFGELVSLLRSTFAQSNTQKAILLAHGTSLVQGNQEIENIANQLNAKVAYWSIQPSLVDILKDMITSGVENITVLPYFLFTGKITQAIASEVNDLQQSTTTQIIIAPTLSENSNFSKIIVDYILGE